MKKLLLSLSLSIIAFSYGYSQSYTTIMTLVVDTNNAPVANQTVTMQIGNAPATGYTITGVTGTNGYYIDSVANISTVTAVTASTVDCNASTVSSTKSYTPNTFFFHDTLMICTGTLSTPCTANYTYSGTASMPNVIGFTNNSSKGTAVGTANYSWTFGDGSSSTQSNPVHTYNAPGNYQVCLTISTVHPQTQVVTCTDVYCDTVVVGTNPPARPCAASYSVDTTMSGAGSVFIWNNSTPLPSASMQVSYLWDFGDGYTSNQPFPVHTYSTSGIYAVCLTVMSVDSAQNACTSTFCDTLGVDSLGNLIYKNTQAGFTLNVLDPASIGLEEARINDVSIYPNPASDVVFVEFGSAQGEVSWTITDMKGSTVLAGTEILNSTQLILDLKNLNKGFYLINLKAGSAVKNLKLMVE